MAVMGLLYGYYILEVIYGNLLNYNVAIRLFSQVRI